MASRPIGTATSFNTLQALLGVTWGVWVSTLSLRALDSSSGIVLQGMPANLAHSLYLVALLVSVSALGYCFLRLEEHIQTVLATGRATSLLNALLWCGLSLVATAPLPLAGAWLYAAGNFAEAAVPPLTVLSWIILLFVRLWRDLRINPL